MTEEQGKEIIRLLAQMINSENDQSNGKSKPQASLTDIYNELVKLNENISQMNQR